MKSKKKKGNKSDVYDPRAKSTKSSCNERTIQYLKKKKKRESE